MVEGPRPGDAGPLPFQEWGSAALHYRPFRNSYFRVVWIQNVHIDH
jgi:hypothetical protein